MTKQAIIDEVCGELTHEAGECIAMRDESIANGSYVTAATMHSRGFGYKLASDHVRHALTRLLPDDAPAQPVRRCRLHTTGGRYVHAVDASSHATIVGGYFDKGCTEAILRATVEAMGWEVVP